MKQHEKEYFSKSYEESRRKFIHETKEFDHEEIQIRCDLYIDVAFKKNDHKKLLILVSGTHGVEGYIGSAAQLIFIKEYLKKLKKTDVLIIHSLNPYGFKHDRRVNENNVDLNRNSVYDERLMLGIPNTFFSNMWADSLFFFKLNRPRRHRFIERIKYYGLVISTIKKKGLRNTLNLSVEGQSSFPHSVAFRGVKLEESLIHFREIIEEKTKGYEEALLIDLHSGVGKKFDLHGYTNQEPHSQNYKLLKKVLKRTKSRKDIPIVEHTGSVTDLFLARSRAKNNNDLTLEYGTIPQIASNFVFEYLGRLNIEENQVFYFGNEKQRIKTKKRYKKAYAPSDIVFKKSLLRKTRKFYDKLIREYEE